MNDLLEAVPVKLSEDDLKVIRETAEFTPAFGTWQTFSLLGIPSEASMGQLILPADKRRRRAFIQVNPLIGAPAQAYGSVTSPGANQALATIGLAALQPGWYQIQWQVELAGTPGSGDANNFVLKGPGLGAVTAINEGAVGVYPQSPYFMYVGPGNAQSVSIRTIAAGTAGAIYSGQVTIIPQIYESGFIRVGTLAQVQNNGGGIIYAGQLWQIRSHEQLYMSGDGLTALTVVIHAERDQEP